MSRSPYSVVAIGAIAIAAAAYPAATLAQKNVQGPPAILAPDLGQLLAERGSELRPVVERYSADRAALTRRYRLAYSPAQQSVMTRFYATWSDKLKALDFAALSPDARADYVLLRHAIEHEQTLLARDAKVWAEVSTLIPFADTIMALEETRREMIPIDAPKSAKSLDNIAAQVAAARAKIESIGRGGADIPAAGMPSRIAAYRATEESSTHCMPRSRAGTSSTRATTRFFPGGRSRHIMERTRRSRPTPVCCASAWWGGVAVTMNRSSACRSVATASRRTFATK